MADTFEITPEMQAAYEEMLADTQSLKTAKAIEVGVEVVKVVEGAAVSAAICGVVKSFCPKGAPWWVKVTYILGAAVAGGVIAHANDKRIDDSVRKIAEAVINAQEVKQNG